MVEKSGKRNCGSISEQELSDLLPRYGATIILTLLQEVALYSDMKKIDWDKVVKNTTTGISNAREYQRLWRHLAYRHSLSGNIEDETEPLVSDDSDLEYELEAYPTISCEGSTEAAAFAKVLMASASQRDPNVPNASSIEAPLIINIPNRQSTGDCQNNSQPVEGTNIKFPIFVQKQHMPSSTIAEPSDTNGFTNDSHQPSRKRRKTWSNAEDMQLIAAVQKCGEGNWAKISKGEFKGDRTTSQLSQRWLLIKKRNTNLNIGVPSSNIPQPSEAQLAARRAMSYALDDMPKRPSISKLSQMLTTSEATLAMGTNPSNQLPSIIPTNNTPKPNFQTSKTPIASSVKAAAVAAGARIASPDDAASLLKSAGNVHIMGKSRGSSGLSFMRAHSLKPASSPAPPCLMKSVEQSDDEGLDADLQAFAASTHELLCRDDGEVEMGRDGGESWNVGTAESASGGKENGEEMCEVVGV